MAASPDLEQLGRRWGWKMENRQHLPRVQHALARQEPVALFQDAGRKNWWESFFGDWPHHLERVHSLDAAGDRVCLIISDRIHPGPPAAARVIFRPPSLALGVSCTPGVAAADLENWVAQFFDQHRLSLSSLLAVASAAGQKQEHAIVEFAEGHEVPFLAYLEDKLALVRRFLPPHETEPICQPAALLAAGAKELLVGQTAVGDAVFAVARRESA